MINPFLRWRGLEPRGVMRRRVRKEALDVLVDLCYHALYCCYIRSACAFTAASFALAAASVAAAAASVATAASSAAFVAATNLVLAVVGETCSAGEAPAWSIGDSTFCAPLRAQANVLEFRVRALRAYKK